MSDFEMRKFFTQYKKSFTSSLAFKFSTLDFQVGEKFFHLKIRNFKFNLNQKLDLYLKNWLRTNSSNIAHFYWFHQNVCKIRYLHTFCMHFDEISENERILNCSFSVNFWDMNLIFNSGSTWSFVFWDVKVFNPTWKFSPLFATIKF